MYDVPESQSPRPLATPLHHRAVPSVFSRPARRTSSNQTAPCCCGSGRTAGNQVLENAYGGRRKHRGIRGLRDRSPHLEMMRRDRRSTLSKKRWIGELEGLSHSIPGPFAAARLDILRSGVRRATSIPIEEPPPQKFFPDGYAQHASSTLSSRPQHVNGESVDSSDADTSINPVTFQK
ncbi:hypothetical protein CIRG_07049 [Coccidioides immitis RMSCC 2394]|uniref:Uncharacterized protein n=1 Tax=Coccidioides immitis RMSCC 2394 TaxID=404692 RepID=A0A0J6YK83_COCIT|nr:hypothetical protein CIRG_07049 [Coccidioides immitis RMSCC 2394]